VGRLAPPGLVLQAMQAQDLSQFIMRAALLLAEVALMWGGHGAAALPVAPRRGEFRFA
jgi:hypothetical protein